MTMRNIRRGGLCLGLLLWSCSSAAASHHHRHTTVTPPAIPLAIGASEMISHGRFDGVAIYPPPGPIRSFVRSEEHTSELQSLMRISYAVFCLKKKTQTI